MQESQIVDQKIERRRGGETSKSKKMKQSKQRTRIKHCQGVKINFKVFMSQIRIF